MGTHRLKRVVDDIEQVGELAHLVIVLIRWDVPLDPHDVLGIDEPEHAFCRHRRGTEPVRVVDQDADIGGIRNISEKPNDVVLRWVVKER